MTKATLAGARKRKVGESVAKERAKGVMEEEKGQELVPCERGKPKGTIKEVSPLLACLMVLSEGLEQCTMNPSDVSPPPPPPIWRLG